MAKSKVKTAKKRVVQVEPLGQAHIHSSFNNIIVTITDIYGNTISWSSAGKNGFKGPAEATLPGSPGSVGQYGREKRGKRPVATG